MPTVSINSLSAEKINAWAQEGKSFRASSMWGEPGTRSTGRLDRKWAELYDAQASEIVYTVYSYATPIAWLTGKGWVVVSQDFSISTSRHQGEVRGLTPKRNGAGYTCAGVGMIVKVLPVEERPFGARGNWGVCPICGDKQPAPKSVIGHHFAGPGAFA